MASPTWTYESRQQRRQRQSMQFRQLIGEVRPYVQAGDIAAAQEIVARRVPEAAPKKKSGGGGLLGGVKGFVGGVAGDVVDVGKRAGGMALEALDVPADYTLRPIIGAGAYLGAEREIDPATGRAYRKSPGWRDIGRGLLEAATQDPLETYREGRTAFRERMADPELGAAGRVLLGGVSDPLTYVGPGAVRGVLRAAPEAIQASRGARLGAALVESPRLASAGGVAGATLAAGAAERADLGPGWQMAAALGGGVLGGGLAGSRVGRNILAEGSGIPEMYRQGAVPGGGMVMNTGRPKGLAPDVPYEGRRVIPDSRLWQPNADPSVQTELSRMAAAYDARGGKWANDAERERFQELARIRDGDEPTRPLANERLWFHSTRSMDFDLPDPDLAVGTQTGITQGPGIYLAADPAKSAGEYGPRTFVTEFDGTTLDLTKLGTIYDPVADNGVTWDGVRQRLMVKLRDAAEEAYATDRELAGNLAAVADTLEDRVFQDATRIRSRSDLAKAESPDTATGYVWRDELAQIFDSVDRDLIDGRAPSAVMDELYGRFRGALGGDGAGMAIVNNALADMGVDAVFHHSPRADGDVLIVLNGEAARVLGDVRNAPDVVKGGKTWAQMRESALSGESRLTDYTTASDDALRAARAGADVSRLGGGTAAAPGANLGARVAARGIRQDVDEIGARQGDLLRPRGVAQLGEGYTTKQALEVGRDLQRQASSQANRLRAFAEAALAKAGRMDDTGHLLDVAPGAEDVLAGLDHPSIYDVIQQPGKYHLTPQQREGLAELAAIPQRIRQEREIFGVGPNLLTIEGDGEFFPRVARADASGRDLQRRTSPAGSRLGGAKDKSRVFETAREAEKNGVVYRSPLEALDDYVLRGLKTAADAHVKGLLAKFGQTPAQRIPEGLRNRVQGIRMSVASLKATGVRLGDRTDAAIDAFLRNNPEDVDLAELRDALDVRVGRSATGAVGPNFGRSRMDVQAQIRQLRDELAELMPDWKQAQQRARQVPPERATVKPEYAPALIGTDFEPDVAKAIERFYGRDVRSTVQQSGRLKEAARAVNTTVIPLKATMDVSAILNQQGRTAVNNPVLFLRNVARSMRDMVDNTDYNRMLQAPKAERAARAGIAILGDAGERNEFQLSNWMQRIPVVGVLPKWANNHYVRFNNRMRIDLFETITEANARLGRPMDALGEEKLARGVNRMTGVSIGRAGDIETLTLFAPNFLRSHLENLHAALLKGDIEGQFARRYLGTFFAAGSALVGAAALAQGRDPAEVLNPLDLDALSRGEIRLNPNFGTVRAGGQDVQVYGPYTSLMRLVAAGVDSAYRSASEQDAMQLFDAIGYAASTKGSPVVSLAADAVKGETFSGEDPFSLPALLERALPISIANAIAARKQGLSWEDAAIDSVINAIGGQSNPLTPTERLDAIAEKHTDPETGQVNGKGFYASSKLVQKQVREQNPSLWQQALDRASVQRQQYEEAKGTARQQQEADDALFLSGQIDRAKWERQRASRRSELYGVGRGIYGERDGTTSTGDPVLDAYYQAVEASKVNGQPQWDTVEDGFLAQLSDRQRAHIEANTGLNATPLEKIYRSLADEYYTLPRYRGYDADQGRAIDELWELVRSQAPSAEDTAMLRTLRRVTGTGSFDPDIVRGVRRRILGLLRQDRARERFAQLHPEAEVLTSQGPLSPRAVAALQARLREAA